MTRAMHVFSPQRGKCAVGYPDASKPQTHTVEYRIVRYQNAVPVRLIATVSWDTVF